MQIAENLGFQRRMWIAERVGWAVLAAIVVAAVLGAFGMGLFGGVHASGPDRSFGVEYRRFGRMQSPSSLRVSLSPRTDDRELRIWISSSYLDRFQVQTIQPEPESTVIGDHRVTFVFALGGAGAAGTVSFMLEAQQPGTARGEIGVGDGAGLDIRQFFYP